MNLHPLQKQLREYATPARKARSESFFKMGPGEYSHGDQFIGVKMGDIRSAAQKYHDLSLDVLGDIIASSIHEDRMCVLIILVNRMKKEKAPQERRRIVDWYLDNKEWVNNWDLVDVSAHYILGQHVLEHPEERNLLKKLIASDRMWDRRIAIVSTWIMNQAGEIDMTLYLAEKLLDDPEDLMHKATGWMLREAWKKKPERVERFITKHYQEMPRTMLLYVIERMEEGKRKRFLKGEL